MMNVEWHKGVNGLRLLKEDWCAIAVNAPLFARYEWNLAAAMHLAGDAESVWFCRVSAPDGRPLSIIPVIPATAAVKPFGEVKALTLGFDHQLAAFDFPLAPDANVAEVGAAMLKAFRGHPYKWTVISWPRVMADSNAARLALALKPQWTNITPSQGCSTFRTRSTPDHAGEGVFSLRSGRLRRNLANRTRRLEKHGPISMQMGREEGNVDFFFDEFLRLESSGWKGESGTRTAIALVPAAKAFYHSLLAESNPSFEADIALMYSGEKAVAGQFVIRTAGWEHLYKIGHDDAFNEFSPGRLLLLRIIERAIKIDGIDRVSLVTGLDWHEEWEPVLEPTLQVHIFRSKWRPVVVRLGRHLLTEYRRRRSRTGSQSLQTVAVSVPE